MWSLAAVTIPSFDSSHMVPIITWAHFSTWVVHRMGSRTGLRPVWERRTRSWSCGHGFEAALEVLAFLTKTFPWHLAWSKEDRYHLGLQERLVNSGLGLPPLWMDVMMVRWVGLILCRCDTWNVMSCIMKSKRANRDNLIYSVAFLIPSLSQKYSLPQTQTNTGCGINHSRSDVEYWSTSVQLDSNNTTHTFQTMPLPQWPT